MPNENIQNIIDYLDQLTAEDLQNLNSALDAKIANNQLQNAWDIIVDSLINYLSAEADIQPTILIQADDIIYSIDIDTINNIIDKNDIGKIILSMPTADTSVPEDTVVPDAPDDPQDPFEEPEDNENTDFEDDGSMSESEGEDSEYEGEDNLDDTDDGENDEPTDY